MNGKQAKLLRKAAVGFAVVQEQTGHKMSEKDVKALYKNMKRGKDGGTDLSGKKHRKPPPL